LVSSDSATRPANFPALTGVRAVAAYLVFFHHFPHGQWIIDHFNAFREFHVGVTIFFVLSGFLIAYRYATPTGIPSGGWRQYLINRFARIYPIYAILTIATLLVMHESSITTWVTQLTLTRGFREIWHLQGIAQGWSLTVEECFYLSAPLFFALAFNRLRWMFVASFALLLVSYALVKFTTARDVIGMPRFLLLHTFFGRSFEFVLGAAFGLFVRKKDLTQRAPIICIATWFGVLGISACIAALVPLGVGRTYGVHHPVGIILNNFVLPFFVVSLFYGLIFERSVLAQLLSTRLFVLLGKSSYVFYLIHMGVISAFTYHWIATAVDQLVIVFPHNGWYHAGYWSLFVSLNLIAIALYKWVEEPLNSWIRTNSRKR
jgi:peptidoglycan/LPS O-acetylase OafA/YrhL